VLKISENSAKTKVTTWGPKKKSNVTHTKDFCVKDVPHGLTRFQFLFIYIYFWVLKLPYVGSKFQDVAKI
jgi:hypothetical protein